MNHPQDPRDSTLGSGGANGTDSHFAQDDIDSRFNPGADGADGSDGPDTRTPSADAGDEHLHRVVDVESTPRDEQAEAAARPPKKRMSLGVLIGGVVLLSIFGWVVYTVLFAKPADTSGQQLVQTTPANVLPADVAPLGAAAAATSAGPAAASEAMMSAAPQAIVPSTAGQPLSAASGVMAAGSVAAVASVAASQAQATSADAQELAQLRSDMERLRTQKAEGERLLAEQGQLMEKLQNQASACAANAAGSAVKPAKPAKVSSAGPSSRQTVNKEQTAKARNKDAASKSAIASAAPAAEVVMDDSALFLKAVVPPSGPNQRAWIMDGDRMISVAAGETVRGAVVKSISAQRVVTSKGTIYPAN